MEGSTAVGENVMCLAIPGEIVEIDDGVATVRIAESLRKASLLLLPEEPRIGDYVIVHAGFALHVVDPAEAAESLRLIQELASFADEELM
jgi:hydrogenase expression/formation protein HypC